MAQLTRANLLTKILALFPKASMANVTNSALQDILSDVVGSAGQPAQSTTIAPTADGLTTGLIPAATEYAIITSPNADYIVTLPALSEVSPGKHIYLEATATAFEIRTPSGSNEKINNVDADGSQEALAAATGLCILRATTAGWLYTYLTEAGALSAPVPD